MAFNDDYDRPNLGYPGGLAQKPPKLPRRLNMMFATPNSALGEQTAVMPNPHQFNAANEAQSNADFAAAAPPLRINPMAPTQPGSMSVTTPDGKTQTRQGTTPLQSEENRVATGMARRGAYVGRQTRKADYLHPGMDTPQFARDDNTRSNQQSASGVRVNDANIRRSDTLLPGEVGQQKSASGLTDAQRERLTQMTPGEVEGQNIQNDRNRQLTPPTVEGANIANKNAQMNPQQLQQREQLLTKENTDLKKRVQWLEGQLMRPVPQPAIGKDPQPREQVYPQIPGDAQLQKTIQPQQPVQIAPGANLTPQQVNQSTAIEQRQPAPMYPTQPSGSAYPADIVMSNRNEIVAADEAARKDYFMSKPGSPEVEAARKSRNVGIGSERTRLYGENYEHIDAVTEQQKRQSAQPTTPPVKVQTRAQVEALPPGTRFIDPNTGVERVRP